jgi:hypothetical protein
MDVTARTLFQGMVCCLAILFKRLTNKKQKIQINFKQFYVLAFNVYLTTVGVNWNSHSEIDTAYTGKCDVALNNKQVLRKCLKALE